MKTYFVTYSDSNFKKQQENLNKFASNFFIVSDYNREWLINTNFYHKNKNILDLKRGSGYWLWKPYIILDCFNKMNYNDILFYLDSADIFNSDLPNFLNQYFSDINNEIILTVGGENLQKNYTKRDCFVLMNCDTDKYHNSKQIEAGILCFRKTQKNIQIVEEWLNFCLNSNILTDTPNVTLNNLDGFIDHRHDQSVLTNLSVKYNIELNSLLRKYIICNVNQ